MTHSALWVADYIVATGAGVLTPLHVLKLTYMSHGYTWGIVGHKLISDKVEAWKYGPVIPTVYEALSKYGSREVDALHYCGTPISSEDNVQKRVEELGSRFSEKEKEVIDCVVDVYKDWTAGQLITLMHREGTPWSQYYVKGGVNIIIPDSVTKTYYEELVNERRQQ
ncbi:MAG: DUF4065 domain-containing protein [Cenarchaeum sp. SB0662_bin_33]|nr:DUF4065 domain-containing protein [Cenarchaeum sp. SB0662_bin_33]